MSYAPTASRICVARGGVASSAARRSAPAAASGAPMGRTPLQASRFVDSASRAAPLVASVRAGENASLHVCRASTEQEAAVAVPVVTIDNKSDAFSTVVKVKFGDYLGQLADTVAELKKLGLNVVRAKVKTDADGMSNNVFFVTDALSAEKVVKSETIEDIRMTIINNMMFYHPEAVGELAAGKHVAGNSSVTMSMEEDETPPRPLGVRPKAVTKIKITDDPEERYTVLDVRTEDRPGSLISIVATLKDINVNVNSAEIDTEGKNAHDIFYLTYKGEPLVASMKQVVYNALQYFLALPSVEKEESY